MESRRNKSGDMRDIREMIRAYLPRNRADAQKINLPRVRGCARDDEFYAMSTCETRDLRIVKKAPRVYAVVYRLVSSSRKCHAMSMRKMASVRQRKAEDGIAK